MHGINKQAMRELRRKYILFAMLITFTISTMVPFFASYDTNVSETTKELAKIFGGKILLCTNDGFKFVDIKDLENNTHEPSDKYKCPLCYIKANSPKHLIAKDIAFLQPISYYWQARYNYEDSLFISNGAASNINSRAPPISFVS